jgi:hypothetical protein
MYQGTAMQPLNTIPIEMFLEKARIARKSGQKTLNLPINDIIMLEESLAVVMTRLAGELDAIALSVQQTGDVSIKFDGGTL